MNIVSPFLNITILSLTLYLYTYHLKLFSLFYAVWNLFIHRHCMFKTFKYVLIILFQQFELNLYSSTYVKTFCFNFVGQSWKPLWNIALHPGLIHSASKNVQIPPVQFALGHACHLMSLTSYIDFQTLYLVFSYSFNIMLSSDLNIVIFEIGKE